jgi:hypothetical protein
VKNILISGILGAILIAAPFEAASAADMAVKAPLMRYRWLGLYQEGMAQKYPLHWHYRADQPSAKRNRKSRERWSLAAQAQSR